MRIPRISRKSQPLDIAAKRLGIKPGELLVILLGAGLAAVNIVIRRQNRDRVFNNAWERARPRIEANRARLQALEAAGLQEDPARPFRPTTFPLEVERPKKRGKKARKKKSGRKS